PETGHTIGGRFRAYWEQHGGMDQQGYPISDEFTEVSALDGKLYLVQYFQRAVFEYHPEYAGTPFEVLLAQVCMLRYNSWYRNLRVKDLATGQTFAIATGPADQVFPSVAGHSVVWKEFGSGVDRIQLKDLDTNLITTIADHPRYGNFGLLAVSGEYVAWYESN